VERVDEVVRNNFYDTRRLTESWYEEFIEDLRKAGASARDDLEFVIGGFILTSGLPVSHVGLERHPGCDKPVPDEDGVEFEWISNSRLLVTVTHMAQQYDQIDRLKNALSSIPKGEGTLIIDLRQATGGDVSAMGLAEALMPHGDVLEAGYLVTSRWWSAHNRTPTVEEARASVVASTRSLEKLVEQIGANELLKLQVEGEGAEFDGKVYVLTSRETASASEPLVRLFQANGLATIVGERTAGKVLSSAWKCVGDDWLVQLPVAMYLDPDLSPLEGRPITPDVPVHSREAMEWVLERASD
jgi:C-terminal processing protease CtpA/Prc